jgi:nucleotide-binding universal stress UspA family protein
MESQSQFDFSRLFPAYMKKVEQIAGDDFRQRLDRFASDPEWQDVEVTPVTDPHKDFVEVIQQVLRHRHDLVVLTDRLENGVDQLAMRLIRKCPCPVWVIRQNHTGEFRRIIGAVDLEEKSDESLELNRKIIEITHSLAQRENGEAHYLHAWRLEFETMMNSPRMNVKPEELAEIKQTIRNEREKAFGSLMKECNIFPAADKIHLVEGSTAETLDRLKDRLHIDVLVMGSVARTGIPGFILGNMAEKILSQINCTVLTVKPDGFITPITL